MRRAWLLLFAQATAGCTWSRFSDVGSDPPVVLLTKPTGFSGFGVGVAPLAIEGKESRVLVGQATGKSAAATFDLGLGTDPSTDAADTSSCDPSQSNDPCFFSDHATGLPLAHVGQGNLEQMCFILGVGKTRTVDKPGLIGRCQDFATFTLPVPESALQNLVEGDVFANQKAAPLALATDKGELPALAAGASRQKLAWFYRPRSTQAVELLSPGTVDAGYGASVAVLRLEADTGMAAGGGPATSGRRLIAVGAPDAGHVWLFRGEDGKPVGCLGGIDGFGHALASGHVDKDDADDLVIADGVNVTVISGAALAALVPVPSIECSFGALPAGAILASFGCGSGDSTAGCPGGFGDALDVGDFDGDGDGEVLVGAPDMQVRGHASAGTVSIFDAEGNRPWFLTDQLYLSSADDNERLGASVGAAHIKGRDVVVAGAPGGGRAAVFYCSVLVPPGAVGTRCKSE